MDDGDDAHGLTFDHIDQAIFVDEKLAAVFIAGLRHDPAAPGQDLQAASRGQDLFHDDRGVTRRVLAMNAAISCRSSRTCGDQLTTKSIWPGRAPSHLAKGRPRRPGAAGRA